MKISFGKWLSVSLAAFVLASFAMTPYADAAGGRGGGGGGGGARASGGGGGGGGARASGGGGGGQRQGAQVNNSKADVRSTNVRSNSVNNVNVDRNVNVNVDNHGGWDNDYHPVARAAAVGATVAVTAAVVGSMVAAPPPGCVPVNYGGMVYQQCGSTWYQPQGTQYIVVNAPN
jgi:hypothetical protein